jgi:hypothetical protein
MDLRRENDLPRQDQVDHAARRASNWNLDQTAPTGAQAPDQHLDDRCLMAIADRRACRRIQTNADIEAEHI